MKKILKNTFSLLNRQERLQFYRLIIFDVAISILDIASLALLLVIVNFYSQPNSGTESSILPVWMPDRQSILPVAVFLVFFSIKNLFGYLLQKSQYGFVYKVAGRLSQKSFLQYLEGNYEGYSSTDSSVHIRKISQHPVEFAQYILAGIQQIFTQSVLIIAALAAVCWFNPVLFVLLFALLMPPVLAIGFFIRKKTRQARVNVKSAGERTLQHLKEGLAGFVESNIYDKHDFFAHRYAGWQEGLNSYLARLQSIQGLSGRLLETFAVTGLFILVAIDKWSGNANAFNLLSIGAFVAAAYKIMPGVVKIMNCSGQVRTYAFTVNDLLQSTTGNQKSKIKNLKEHIGSVEFHNVSFCYEKKLVLKDFNFSIHAGDFTAVSGISGKGKTTMLNLLLGFLIQDEGEIAINAVSADPEERAQYRQHISYVKQQPFVIHDSLVNNIVLNDNEIDEERLVAAIAAAGLHDLINADKEGLDQLVTEAGKNISGGQRQRIMIARALYKNADLIILDEPFNELDKASEQALLKHFSTLASMGKMILLVTHNKESFSFCNKVIYLDEK